MLSQSHESQLSGLQNDSSGEECLDDIKPELISLTLSGSNCSASSFEEQCAYIPSTGTLKANCDINPVRSEKDSLVVLSLSSGESTNPSTQTITTYDNVESNCTGYVPLLKDNYETQVNCYKNTSIPFGDHKMSENTDLKNEFEFLQNKEQQCSGKPITEKKLSLSLHDVSTFPEFQEQKNALFSSDVFQSQSMTTVPSGLPRSVSCLSLKNGYKSYAHIQSKVKQYIKHIKDKEECNKFLKAQNIIKCNSDPLTCNCKHDENSLLVSEESLVTVIKDLQSELEDKEAIRFKLQENYDKLLLKYADAENRIDQLRFKVLDSSMEFTNQNLEKEDLRRPIPSENCFQCSSRFNSEMNSLGKVSNELQKVDDTEAMGSLSPISKLYSSSLRLDVKNNPLNSKHVCSVCNQEKEDSFSEHQPIASSCRNSSVDNLQRINAEHKKLSKNKNSLISKEDNANKDQFMPDVLGYKTYDINAHVKKSKIQMPLKNRYMKENSSMLNGTVKRKGINLQNKTTFSKEEEELPEELIEGYGSFDYHIKKRKAIEERRKIISSVGRNSGCAGSELCSCSPQQCPRLPALQFEYPGVLRSIDMPVLDLKQKPRSHSTPHIFASSSVTSNATPVLSKLHNNQQEMTVQVCNASRTNAVFPNSTAESLHSITQCECWKIDQTSHNFKESNVSKNVCMQKEEDTLQDFNVPSLKLGSLLDDDTNTEDITYSHDLSNSLNGKIILNNGSCTALDDNINCSHEGTTDDVTYPSSTSVSCSALNMHTDTTQCDDKTIEPLTDVSNLCSQHNNIMFLKSDPLKKYTSKEIAIRKKNKKISIKNSLHEESFFLQSETSNTSYKNIPPFIDTCKQYSCFEFEDSQQPSTSTSYKSVRPFIKSVLETESQVVCNDSPDPTDRTSTSFRTIEIHEKLSKIVSSEIRDQESKNISDSEKKTLADKNSYHCFLCGNNKLISETQDDQYACKNVYKSRSSSYHCTKRQSDVSGKRIVGMALRLLLSHLLISSNKCDCSSCIVKKSLTNECSCKNRQAQTEKLPSKTKKSKHTDDKNQNCDNGTTGSKKNYNYKTVPAAEYVEHLKKDILCHLRNQALVKSSDDFVKRLCTKLTRCNDVNKVRDENNKIAVEDLECKENLKDIAGCKVESWVSESSNFILSSEKEHSNLLKCLEEIANTSQQLRSSSEKILNILNVKKEI